MISTSATSATADSRPPDELITPRRARTKAIKQKRMRQLRFLGVLPSCRWVISKASVEAGISRRTVHRWLANDAWFVRKLEETMSEEEYLLNDILHKQAAEKNSTTAAIFLLRSKHRYQEPKSIEHNINFFTDEQRQAVTRAVELQEKTQDWADGIFKKLIADSHQNTEEEETTNLIDIVPENE